MISTTKHGVETTQYRSRSMSISRSDVLVAVLMFFTMLMGGYFRFIGQEWDDFVRFHPDERYLAGVVSALGNPLTTNQSAPQLYQECLERYPETNGVGGYLDTDCSNFHPENVVFPHYVYGTVPLYMTYLTSEFAADWTDNPVWTSYEGVFQVWRSLSAVADVIVIWLVFLIGLRLHGKWVGLTAAILYAAAVTPIQQAHFGTADAITNLFVTLAIFFAVRTQDSGSWWDYGVFGLALGLAVASRVNVAPLTLIIIIVAILRAMPAFDASLTAYERNRLVMMNFIGLCIAAIASFVTFRLAHPHTFTGPGFFGIFPDERYLQTIAHGQFLVSGESDGPPNWQWIGRIGYLFPLQNMVLWGMGITLGLTAWFAWAWSGVRLLLGRPSATRNLVLFSWVLIHFGIFGNLWVMSMRYYLPLYPALAVLAAWALVEWIKRANAAEIAWRQWVSRAALLGVVGFTMLWALMFTNIYRSMATFTQASHWVWENVPGDFSMQVEGAPENTPLINIPVPNSFGLSGTPIEEQLYQEASRLTPGIPVQIDFTVPADGTITTVQAHRIGDPFDSPEEKTLEVAITAEREVFLGAAELADDANADTYSSGAPYEVRFDTPFVIEEDRIYSVDVDPNTLQITIRADGELTLVQAFLTNVAEGAIFLSGAPYELTFNDDFTIALNETVTFTVDEESQQTTLSTVRNVPLTQASVTDVFAREAHILGSAYELTLDSPLEVREGETYTLSVGVAEGTTLMTSGAIMALESAWEEVMPAKVCRLPDGITLADDPPSGLNTIENCNGRSVWDGLLNGYLLETHWEDIPEKRDRMQTILDQTDYVMIPTNRRYDTNTRNPSRWPMTTRFYEALFDGELGFELEAMFQETFELGPLKVSDQHLPIYDSPDWLNEFEAEEAFHVYDHPVVFVFRKTDAYTSENTALILDGEPLNRVSDVFFGYFDETLPNVMAISSLQADESPSQLQMTEEIQDIQTEGGTWAERFNRDGVFNTNQVLTTILWWLALVTIGFVAWPLLFMAFPALADRGYGFAKFTGMFLIAWSAWALSAMRVAMWSQAGLFIILLALAVISGVIVWRNREKFRAFVASKWRLIVVIEVVSLVLYLIMIGVRLTNPDLWHVSFGGEKPMDFAYFNAVLRSTVFPAIDPWFAGGYLNYYYFGFVIVGVPTLLLGVVPSLAYNLIVPTIFAATGIAAFSMAFSIASGWRVRMPVEETEYKDGEAQPQQAKTQRRPLGSPWVAAFAALILAVILGNLDTGRVFANGVARLGGYDGETSLQQYLANEYRNDFIAENGTTPDGTQLSEIARQAQLNSQNPSIADRLSYGLDYPVSFVSGIGRLLRGQPMYISPERWFWGPTRVITEIPGQADGAITEMPYFTFLYGDLHAHMISMPMQLFALAFLFNELMVAGRDRRRWWVRILALALGAMTVGLFQATNTWEYPTFMILSVLGLGYAWWLGWKGTINRWSLLSLAWRVGGFVAISTAAALPFTLWFASGITDFKIWEGKKTPLWAYLTIHGTFIFLLVSLLLWETARWLRSVKVTVLRGRLMLLYAVAAATLMVLVGVIILSFIGYEVALVVLPLVIWIAILFFRPQQSRPMQFVLVIAGLALAITFGTEIITLANDNGRQNTVFKFYLQAWLLLSVACGVGLSWVVSNSARWRLRLATPWYAVAILLVFLAGMYPLQATRGKAAFRLQPEPPTTLDGMDYMRYARHSEDMGPIVVNDDLQFVRYAVGGEFGGMVLVDGTVQDRFTTIELVHDYNAIRWLQENVEGSPVIMEAQSHGSLYKWGGRISIYTGLPSVVGWDFHQTQQRSIGSLPALVRHRAANVNGFYTTHNIFSAIDILRFYDVRYIIVTPYERARYGDSGGLDKFDRMVEMNILSEVYQEGEATIYEVDDTMLDAVVVASLINANNLEAEATADETNQEQ